MRLLEAAFSLCLSIIYGYKVARAVSNVRLSSTEFEGRWKRKYISIAEISGLKAFLPIVAVLLAP